MEIIEAPGGGFNLRKSGEGRSAGVHLSQVIRVIAIKGGILKADNDELGELIEDTTAERCGEDGRLVRVAMGLAWEEWLEKQYTSVIFHPGEYELDGVFASPDGVGSDASGFDVWLEEYKTTYKSAFRPIKDAWMWWEQCRGYCKIMGLTKAVLRVLYINGDYRGSGPLFRSYQATFTQEELDTSWNRILAYRDQVVPEKGRVKGAANARA